MNTDESNRWPFARKSLPSAGSSRSLANERPIGAKVARKVTFDTRPHSRIVTPAKPTRPPILLGRKTVHRQGDTSRAGRRPSTNNVTFLASSASTPRAKQPTRINANTPSNRRVSIITPTVPEPIHPHRPVVTKSSPITPYWHESDDKRAAELGRQRKDTSNKRAEPTRRWKYARKQIGQVEAVDNQRGSRSYFGRGLTIHRADGSDVEMMSTSDEDSDGAPPPHAGLLQAARKTVAKRRTATKSFAARKLPEEDEDMDIDDEDDEENNPAWSDNQDSAGPPTSDGEDSSEEREKVGEDEEEAEEELEIISISSDDEQIIEDDISPLDPIIDPTARAQTVLPVDGLPSELLQAIKPFLPQLSEQNLPMKVSHLRLAFERKCITHGVMTAKIVDEHVSFHAVYRCAVSTSTVSRDTDRQNNSYTVIFNSWKCPLCSFYGVFSTQQMLKSHLEWDHAEAKFLWDQGDEEHALRIILTFPEFAETTNDNFPNRPFIYAYPISGETTQIPILETDAPPAEPKPRIEDLESQRPSPLTEPPQSRSPTFSATPAPPSTRASSTSSFKFATRSPSPDSFSGSVPPSSRERSTTVSTISTTTTTWTPMQTPPPRNIRPRVSHPPSSSTRETTQRNFLPFPDLPPPPPYEDRLGPAARRPYLPASTPSFIREINERHRWENHYIHHSCRPQGETLFDFLGVLPLAPFGVMAWSVLDREEEIFESDDMRDENKVICALWARWIFLNRRKFIADFELGFLDFIDEYGWMIYWAAGWRALRYWLLILMANRYLNASQVANALKHYERNVQMDHWYAEDHGSIGGGGRDGDTENRDQSFEA
ncbi:hypothetical protein VKT23_005148 [Stygiomarasmius scandens]|uniref:C2H2-type domain-containing protein n=1 Tax=Marasmiellus scandens TaxID=2682957 RepID=A0ABR1JVJ3_9AGAR